MNVGVVTVLKLISAACDAADDDGQVSHEAEEDRDIAEEDEEKPTLALEDGHVSHDEAEDTCGQVIIVVTEN